MQTNREDCGSRYREIILPKPPNKKWALKMSAAFRDYFSEVAKARERFVTSINNGSLPMIASATGAVVSALDDSAVDDGCNEDYNG